MTRALLTFMWYVNYCLLLVSLLPAYGRGQVRHTNPHVQYGTASWYGEEFHGRRTANGDVYDMFQLTAAHKSAPLGIQAIVTNLDTGRSVRVRINDRGPFVDDRILDLSYAAANRLGILETGLARVKVQFLPETIPVITFLVQAGAYRDRHNAVRVHRALAAQYSKVWITTASDESPPLHHVLLGPFASRATAELVARKVQGFGYAALVIPLSQPPGPLKPSADRF
jgi:rare lipoprotein A